LFPYLIFIFPRALADIDNRGKLNMAEFQVAIGLIYRSEASATSGLTPLTFMASELDGNEIPEQLPEELVPVSAQDLNHSVGFLRGVLKHGTHRQSPENVGDPVVRPPIMKHQPENTARRCESDKLEHEMLNLHSRIKHLRDGLNSIYQGSRSYAKEVERQKLEQELSHLLHEKLPDLEERIEENQARQDEEKQEQMMEGDYRLLPPWDIHSFPPPSPNPSLNSISQLPSASPPPRSIPTNMAEMTRRRKGLISEQRLSNQSRSGRLGW
jgi:hypothetical protein